MPKKCTPPYSNYQDCLKSVSDGKSLVASTITANGVATSADDSFAVINANIASMVGSKVGINVFTQPYEPGIKEGVWIQTSVPYNKIIADPYILNIGGQWGGIGPLPYGFYNGASVVYNGEIHILGGEGGQTNHYAWNGSSWRQVSVLPYNFCLGSAVVYNGEIHIMGTTDDSNYNKDHWAFNGSSWRNVGNLPYEFNGAAAVVYNGEIHIMGTAKYFRCYTNHYAWNGSSWRRVSTLPYNFYYGSAVVYNGEIHILGGNEKDGGYTYYYHYVFNGSSWRSVNTLPYDFRFGSAVVYNGEIHILGSGGGSSSTKYYTNHYAWNGSSWESVSTLPYKFYYGSSVVYGKSIYNIGGNYSATSYCAFTSPDKLFDPHTVIIQRGNVTSGVYQTCFSDTFGKITGGNNRLLTGFDDIWYFLETSLDTSCPIYYGDGSSWIKIKN